ncbi:VCBS repeat-containing protein [archaeon]|nr:MAG: VCBS repeat-containing protein [archaeon]
MHSFYAGPITIPLTPDGEINKIVPDYLQSQHIGKTYHIPKPPQDIPQHKSFQRLDNRIPSCNLDFQLEWTVQTEGPIVSTPVIFPSYSQSEHKSILINTAQQYIELIEGNGKRPQGWPISFQHSQFFASPLVFDIDGDGHQDVGAVDYHGMCMCMCIYKCMCIYT